MRKEEEIIKFEKTTSRINTYKIIKNSARLARDSDSAGSNGKGGVSREARVNTPSASKGTSTGQHGNGYS